MRLSPKELRGILSKPPGSLTADDLRFLRGPHIESLSPRHIASLSTKQILGLKVEQVAALTQEQVAVLSLEQMGLAPAALRAKAIKLQCVNANKAKSEAQAVIDRQLKLVVLYLLIIPFLWILRKLNLN